MKKEPKTKVLVYQGVKYTFKETSLKRASWVTLTNMLGVATAFANVTDIEGNILSVKRIRLTYSKTDSYIITSIESKSK